ncbi:MAG: MraZ N-terminal domain-containing protein [Candidatus Bathyarchaeia archaeon]
MNDIKIMVNILFDLKSLKETVIPLYTGGNMEEHITLKIDSKGRLCIPKEFREEIGEAAIMKKTPQGFLIVPGKQENFIEAFNKTILSEPKRKGKPKLATPEEMKTGWRTVK